MDQPVRSGSAHDFLLIRRLTAITFDYSHYIQLGYQRRFRGDTGAHSTMQWLIEPSFLSPTVAGAVTIMACESRLSDLGDGNATTHSVPSKNSTHRHGRRQSDPVLLDQLDPWDALPSVDRFRDCRHGRVRVRRVRVRLCQHPERGPPRCQWRGRTHDGVRVYARWVARRAGA